jgi:hypothetical protein
VVSATDLCGLILGMKLMGITIMRFDVTDQLLIRFSGFARYCRKNGSRIRQYISYS